MADLAWLSLDDRIGHDRDLLAGMAALAEACPLCATPGTETDLCNDPARQTGQGFRFRLIHG